MFGIGKTRTCHKVIEYGNGEFSLECLNQRKSLFGWKTYHSNVVNTNFYYKSKEEVIRAIEEFNSMGSKRKVVSEEIVISKE